MSEPGVWIELHDLADGDFDEWRSWYDRTYLRQRVAISGVTAGRRGRGVVDRIPHPVPAAAPKEIALYELSDIEVAGSDAWREVGSGSGDIDHRAIVERADRGLYRQLSSTVTPYRPANVEILHGGFFEVPARYHEEFNAWYELEHVPEQSKVPGYQNVRRFQGVDDTERFVALYDVTRLEATETGAASAAMSSPWGDRVRHTLVKSRARRLFRVERVEIGASEDAAEGRSR